MGFLSSISGIASAAIGAGASVFGAVSQNQASRRAVDEANEFSERTLRNRYQWTVEDMRNAGLNPMLAYQQGAGSGAQGAMYQPQNVGAGVGPAINTAVSAAAVENTIKKQEKEIKLIEAQEKNTQQDTKVKKAVETNTFSDTVLKHAQQILATSQSGVHNAQSSKIQEETVLTKLDQFRAEAVASGAKSEKEILDTTLGKFLRWVDVIGRSVNPFSKAVR